MKTLRTLAVAVALAVTVQSVGAGTAEPDYAFPSSGNYRFTRGMTLRDYFAGQVLEGMAANPENKQTTDGMARLAYQVADKMLAAREGAL